MIIVSEQVAGCRERAHFLHVIPTPACSGCNGFYKTYCGHELQLQLFFSAHEASPLLRAQSLLDEACGQLVKRVEHPFLLPIIHV